MSPTSRLPSRKWQTPNIRLHAVSTPSTSATAVTGEQSTALTNQIQPRLAVTPSTTSTSTAVKSVARFRVPNLSSSTVRRNPLQPIRIKLPSENIKRRLFAVTPASKQEKRQRTLRISCGSDRTQPLQYRVSSAAALENDVARAQVVLSALHRMLQGECSQSVVEQGLWFTVHRRSHLGFICNIVVPQDSENEECEEEAEKRQTDQDMNGCRNKKQAMLLSKDHTFVHITQEELSFETAAPPLHILRQHLIFVPPPWQTFDLPSDQLIVVVPHVTALVPLHRTVPFFVGSSINLSLLGEQESLARVTCSGQLNHLLPNNGAQTLNNLQDISSHSYTNDLEVVIRYVSENFDFALVTDHLQKLGMVQSISQALPSLPTSGDRRVISRCVVSAHVPIRDILDFIAEDRCGGEESLANVFQTLDQHHRIPVLLSHQNFTSMENT